MRATLLSALAYAAVGTESGCTGSCSEANEVLLLQKNLKVDPMEIPKPSQPAHVDAVNDHQRANSSHSAASPVQKQHGKTGLLQQAVLKGVRAFSDWDPELLERDCLGTWVNETGISMTEVCSDGRDNNIKDDKGNYIQFTRREDRLMYSVWEHAFEDCQKGETYVRDMIASFAERASCFVNETGLLDEPHMYKPVKVLKDGDAVETGEMEKAFCKGDKDTPNQTTLDRQLGMMRALVEQWDSTEHGPGKADLCREMLAAHTLDKYEFVGALHSSRPAVCNSAAEYYDEALCQASETYLHDFLSRDLFVNIGEGERGRAADGENERSERCKEEQFQGRKWTEMVSMNPGQTVEIPDCSIDHAVEVFPEPVLKVGLYHEDMANNIVADAYRQCGAPFIAGISATMPQYLASVTGGPTKKGMKFEEAASLKEIMVLMSLLELGGFHAVTGLSMAVNFYYKDLLVTPPFDSGAFEASEDDDFIRCHDSTTSCCYNATKTEDGFYNVDTYLKMIEDWEGLMEREFVTVSTEAVAATSTSTQETKSGASSVAGSMLLGLGLVALAVV